HNSATRAGSSEQSVPGSARDFGGDRCASESERAISGSRPAAPADRAFRFYQSCLARSRARGYAPAHRSSTGDQHDQTGGGTSYRSVPSRLSVAKSTSLHG